VIRWFVVRRAVIAEKDIWRAEKLLKQFPVSSSRFFTAINRGVNEKFRSQYSTCSCDCEPMQRSTSEV
jgi:hypothetical protein